jgi:hypothetical protein
LNGLEAIAAHNGWVMAISGAAIVFCGLAILSLVISQLYKVLALLEKRPAAEPAPAPPAKTVAPPPRQQLPAGPLDIDASALAYQPLVDQLGDRFELAALHRLAEEHHLPHPHLTIRNLREAGIVVSEGEGMFTWQRP